MDAKEKVMIGLGVVFGLAGMISILFAANSENYVFCTLFYGMATGFLSAANISVIVDLWRLVYPKNEVQDKE